MLSDVKKGTWRPLGPWPPLGTWRPIDMWWPSGRSMSRGVREGT